jgi:hypothetical protein
VRAGIGRGSGSLETRAAETGRLPAKGGARMRGEGNACTCRSRMTRAARSNATVEARHGGTRGEEAAFRTEGQRWRSHRTRG